MTPQCSGGRVRSPGLLLVDPDTLTRSALARDMERQGWLVWAAGDGATALETYRLYRDRIDVALVDLQLPGLQGGRLLTELGQLDPDLSRCAMSGGVSAYTASAFRRVSATPLFTKPIDPRALAAALNELLAHIART